MDWTLAIERNRSALLRLIVVLMNSLGLVEGGSLTTLPYHLYRKALLILRPAEAAVRRLIMMAAYVMELRGVKLRKASTKSTRRASAFPNAIDFAPSFNLIDPLKTFGGDQPDYASFGQIFEAEITPQNTANIPAAGLGRRLLALQHALNTLEKQARRLTRWYHQRDAALQQNRPHRLSPLRPGPAPYSQKRSQNEVTTVLQECHALALYARERPDSS